MKRRHLLPMALLCAAALLAAAAVMWQRIDPNEPVSVSTRGTDTQLTVTWAGDTMLGDSAAPSIASYGYAWPLAGVAALLVGDVVIVNAEAPITSIAAPLRPEKLYSYHADPASAYALANAGVDVLGLANNHSMDVGELGLIDTLDHARQARLATFGAGPTLRDAERPLLIESGVGTVGVVAMGKNYGSDVTARADQAGTVPFSSAAIARGYRLAKAAGADWVVAYVHWGENYQDVRPDQLVIAERFAAAGYDLVVGHGPHVVQGIGQVGSMPVVYSLGNFVFGAGGRFAQQGQEGHGLVLTTTFVETGLRELQLTCIHTDNRRVAFQPVACTVEESRAMFSRLHGGIVMDGGSGRLAVDADGPVPGPPLPLPSSGQGVR